jgi:Retrotransposon gag protein/Retroviral aspartyl protease
VTRCFFIKHLERSEQDKANEIRSIREEWNNRVHELEEYEAELDKQKEEQNENLRLETRQRVLLTPTSTNTATVTTEVRDKPTFTQVIQSKTRVDYSKFDGQGDVDEWLVDYEARCRYNGDSACERIEFQLTNEAKVWWRGLSDQDKTDWNKIRDGMRKNWKRIIDKFNMKMEYLVTKQLDDENVSEYHRRLERMRIQNQLSIDESDQVKVLVKGLNKQIKSNVALNLPEDASIEQALTAAQRAESVLIEEMDSTNKKGKKNGDKKEEDTIRKIMKLTSDVENDTDGNGRINYVGGTQYSKRRRIDDDSNRGFRNTGSSEDTRLSQWRVEREGGTRPTCYMCGKLGHVKKYCYFNPDSINYRGRPLNKQTQYQQQGQSTELVPAGRSIPFQQQLQIAHQRGLTNKQGKQNRALYLNLLGQFLYFLIDSGADKTCISEHTYGRLVPKPRLTPSDCELYSVSKQRLTTIGQFQTTGYDRNGSSILLTIYVVKEIDVNIIGNDVIDQAITNNINCVFTYKGQSFNITQYGLDTMTPTTTETIETQERQSNNMTLTPTIPSSRQETNTTRLTKQLVNQAVTERETRENKTQVNEKKQDNKDVVVMRCSRQVQTETQLYPCRKCTKRFVSRHCRKQGH